MNWLDIAILSVVGMFTLFGFMRGFIREVFSLTALFGGIIAAVMFYDLAGDLLIEHGILDNEVLAGVAGFLIIMFVVYVLFQILAWVLTRVIGTLHLSWLNRAGGGVLGAAKGILIAFSLISAGTFVFPEKEPPFSNSVLLPYLNQSFKVIKEAIPQNFSEKIQRVRKAVEGQGTDVLSNEGDNAEKTLKDGKEEKKEK